MKAIVLLSGGIDSTVILAMALKQNKVCKAISFDYGQRHKIELESAKKIAAHYGVEHHIIAIDPCAFAQSSLTRRSPVPKYEGTAQTLDIGIPSTYVPARNTLFLAYALGQAEMAGAAEIYIGPNALDCKPYPDCRPEYIDAFQEVANLATKQAVEGHPPQIIAPLLTLDKKQIVIQGRALDVPLHLTFSCYDPTPDGLPCNHCLACLLRAEAMEY